MGQALAPPAATSAPILRRFIGVPFLLVCWTPMPGYTKKVLYSDRDIRAAIDAGDLIIDPFDPELVQPSSVDVRMDRHFRVFNNSKYTHIDPKTSSRMI